MRKTFPIIVEDLMKKNKKIFCLLGDIGVFSFRNVFKNFKDRILNMSTMEQSMIGFAAGLSKAGYVPIIHTIAPFLVLRALDQIKIDFVYNKLGGNIVSVGASNDYTKLGTTHHCFEDINILSNYEDINLFIPSNETEFKYLFKKFYNNNSINYFRIGEKKINFYLKSNGYLRKKKNKSLLIIVGNSFDYKDVKKKNIDIYYVNKINKKINLKFLNNYNKILILEPYFGNVLERKIKKDLKKDNNIFTISYRNTIIHKYGTKDEQDKFLRFDKKNILKNINEFC
jgi:transketolase